MSDFSKLSLLRGLTKYEIRFEREYGFFRPIVKEVVEKYLDCGNPRCGFARIRCPDCAEERLTFLEPEGKVGYRWGREGAGREKELLMAADPPPEYFS